MQFFISKYHTTNNIESIVEKGEDTLFFMGNAFAFSMPYSTVIKSGKKAGEKKEHVSSVFFTYFLDFDFYEKKLNLTFDLVANNSQTNSFCFFSNKSESKKMFEDKKVTLRHGSEYIHMHRSYISRIDSNENEADLDKVIHDFLKKEIHESIDILHRRVIKNNHINLDKQSEQSLSAEIKNFHQWGDIFTTKTISENFQEYMDLYKIDYMKNKLENNLKTNESLKIKNKI